MPDECFDQTNLDEHNCQSIYYKFKLIPFGISSLFINFIDCGPDKFLCSRSEVPASQQPICLDLGVRCNGLKECPKGEDELNCSKFATKLSKRQNFHFLILHLETKGPKVLLCEDQKQSVNKEQWCDGTEDCIDGSDEQYCVYK